jgi:hypothetical protein
LPPFKKLPSDLAKFFLLSDYLLLAVFLNIYQISPRAWATFSTVEVWAIFFTKLANLLHFQSNPAITR